MAGTYLVHNKTQYPLSDSVCFLGRDPTCCTLSFDDPELSRKHVLIVREGNHYVLMDYRSTNGVQVNDTSVEQVVLKNGDWIRIGQQKVQFVEEGPVTTSQTSMKKPESSAVSRRGGAGQLTRMLNLSDLSAIKGVNPESSQATLPDPGNVAVKLAKLCQVGRALNADLKLANLVEKVIESALEVMRADRGLLMLWDEATQKMVVAAHRAMETVLNTVSMEHISRSIVEHTYKSRQGVLVQDALKDMRFESSRSIQMYNIRSAICVPLINRDEFIGVLYVDNRIENSSFAEEDKELLTAFADQATVGIKNARLLETIGEETRKRANLSRFLSRNIVEKIMAHKGDLTLGGEKIEATMMFADIRGFTTFSESRESPLVVEFLNEVLTGLTRIAFEKGGTLDKYLGDGLMAVFGAPFKLSDGPFLAVGAAIEMQRMMQAKAAEWEARFGFTGRLGIGINTGDVTSGYIGSPERLEYTVIGDAVNLAARLQALATEGDVLVSPYTLELLGGRFSAETLGPRTIKGKSQPVEVFRVTALMP